MATIIDNKYAGVGDVVYASAELADFIVVHGDTSSDFPSTITNNSTTYYKYGVIYSFVKDITAFSNAAKPWAAAADGTSTNDYKYIAGLNSILTVPSNTQRLRNGKSCTIYGGMHLASLKQTSYTGTAVHPSAVWPTSGSNVPMSKDSFEASEETTALYNSYDDYLQQAMVCYGASGLFSYCPEDTSIELLGKKYTSVIGGYTASDPCTDEALVWASSDTTLNGTHVDTYFPAANYCYTYAVSNVETADDHNWWLPTMLDLSELMRDEHFTLVQKSTNWSVRAARWSCLPCSSTSVWCYGYSGFSYATLSYDSSRLACPVRLLSF